MFEKEAERLKFLILEVVCNRCDSLNCDCDVSIFMMFSVGPFK